MFVFFFFFFLSSIYFIIVNNTELVKFWYYKLYGSRHQKQVDTKFISRQLMNERSLFQAWIIPKYKFLAEF